MNEMKRSADYTPSQGAYTPITPFRYFCQKVLPLVYDDSLSYYELLCKVVNHLNTVINNTNGLQSDVTNLYNAFVQLQQYVNTYFDTLDIQADVDKKLDEMAADGTLAALFAPTVADIAQPKIVASIAEMANDKYTYVLQSNGHMYQYQNGNWVDSGLVLGGSPNDLFGIKAESPADLNTLVYPGIYYHTKSETPASNTPNDASFANGDFMVISYYEGRRNNFQMFFSKDTSETYIRHQIDAEQWSNWIEVNTTSSEPINANLNLINVSGVSYHSSSDATASNTPNDALYGAGEFMVINYKFDQRNWQLFYGYNQQIAFIRHKLTATTWTAWVAIMGDHRFLPNDDLNEISVSGCFLHAPVDNEAANTPDNLYGSQTFMLESHYFSASAGYQLFYPYNIDTCYIRHKVSSTVWSKWACINTTGNKLPANDLNDIKVSGAFFHSASDDVATNTPDDSTFGDGHFMVVCYYADNETKNYQMFFDYALSGVYVRRQINPTRFAPWRELGAGGGSEALLSITKETELTFLIDFGGYTCTLRHDTDSNTNTDIWTLIDFKAKGVNTSFNVYNGQFTPYGENNPIGGHAGNESTSTLLVSVDGKKIDLAAMGINEKITGLTIDIETISRLSRRGFPAASTTRHVKQTIVQNKITVTQTLKRSSGTNIDYKPVFSPFIIIKQTDVTAVSTNILLTENIASIDTSYVDGGSKTNRNMTVYTNFGSVTLNYINNDSPGGYLGYASRAESNETIQIGANLSPDDYLNASGGDISWRYDIIFA